MTVLRTIAIALTSIILSAFLLVASTIASVVVATASGKDVVVPGLVEVTAGDGAELASVSAGDRFLVWFAVVATVFTVAGIVWLRRRGRRA
ncbi:hypothetical protein [Curtobacterium oceanosedimentum]|uniref:Uncharacterized protein n=1 Tax=Curtobacterium oceanosedimentum TaxID=465820 RepID=A0A147DRD1_9MICO|nr:hypothetical protein [Curtobacterium oceanosedimentum]KTR52256.1 hypothetical protein NS359_06855 [Curtobacterium oceanosedimentum]